MGLGMAEEGASSCIGVTSPNLGGSEEEESREHRSPCGQAYRLPGDLDTHHSPTQAPRLVSEHPLLLSLSCLFTRPTAPPRWLRSVGAVATALQGKPQSLTIAYLSPGSGTSLT